MRFLDYIVDWWLQRCPHDSDDIAADILEGGANGIEVKYCRRCGAVRPSYTSTWRRARPLWKNTG